MIGLGLRLRALGRPGHWGTCSFPKKEKHPWAVGHSGTRANARFQKTALGTRALGHLLFSKKKEKHPWAVGHSGKCSFPKKQPWALGHSGTSSFPKKKKNTFGQLGTRANARFQKTVMGTRALGHSGTHQKTIKRLSNIASIANAVQVTICLLVSTSV